MQVTIWMLHGLLAMQPPSPSAGPSVSDPAAPSEDEWSSPAPGATPSPGPEPVPTPEEVQNRTGTDFGAPDEQAATGPRSGSPSGQPTPEQDAPPPPGVRALGRGAMTPLPPPPPPVDPSTITPGPWRGAGWLDVRLRMSGALGGDDPARSNVVAWGGGLAIGWRINNWVGVAGGFTRGPHYVRERSYTVDGFTVRERFVEYLTAFDAFGRFFVPVEGRIQPWGDLGLAFALREQSLRSGRPLGGLQVRAGLGVDFWVARSITLGLGTTYRMTHVERSLGHQLGGQVDLGFHW